MNTIGKLILVGFLSMIFLNSCIDSDIDPVGYGDAFILVEISGQDTLMGLGLHAFSYSEFTTVNVQHETDISKSYTLQAYLGYAQDFVWSTPRNEYSRALPVAGDYIFSATFRGGHTQVFYDKLYATVVYPPKLTKCLYNSDNQKVEVEWDRVSNADSYNVKLLNTDGDILFVSPVFNRITDIYIFDKSTQGWQTSSFPTVGQNVTVEVASYLLEVGANGNELQSVGKSRQVITWGN
jgi:hypothetical protein